MQNVHYQYGLKKVLKKMKKKSSKNLQVLKIVVLLQPQ